MWALNKDPAIKHLLLRLEEEFGKGSFHLAVPQETNLLSVRIIPSDDSMSIYLYCYGQNSRHYGVHFEFAPSSGLPATLEEEIHDEVPMQRLIDMLSLYLF